MGSTERADPAWVAHETNAVLLRFAEKLGIATGHLKSELKKIAADWPNQQPEAGCPQAAYLTHCVRQAALAAVFADAIEPIRRAEGDADPRVRLAAAITDEVARGNDWSGLEEELWASLEKPGLPAERADAIAEQLEVLESERVLADPPGGPLVALRPSKEGPSPVYSVDAKGCSKVADDLIEWLTAEVEKI